MTSVCALICEYNPFHKGHKYQLDILKKEFEHIICIMSGATVQRGEFALADKYLRAKAAVLEGASIVLELPYPYSSLGARDFATSGVNTALALGVPALAFGAEDEISVLKGIADFLSKEETKNALNISLKNEKNLSYPQIREIIVCEALGFDYGEVLSKPNNILAIEYMLAGGDKLNYFVVKRNIKYKNASSIRNLTQLEMLNELPKESARVFQDTNRRNIKTLEKAILSKLRTANTQELYGIYDITTGLAMRLIKAAIKAKDIDELFQYTSAKTDTNSKLRRAVLHCFIGGTKEKALEPLLYSNLLAAKKESLYILKKQYQNFTILSKPAHYKRMTPAAREQFQLAAKAEFLATLAGEETESGEMFLKSSPIII